jgi:hypothetical protein
MGVGVSSDAEFGEGAGRQKSGSRREKGYSKDAWDAAYWRAQREGGTAEEFVEEEARHLRKGRPYDDTDLISAGFREVASYPYTDQHGALLYQSVRYEHISVPTAKKFRQRRQGSDGKWYADAGQVKVPYRWKLLTERPEEIVCFTEGEKDADTLIGLDCLATTLAGQQWSAEAAKALKGRDVVVFGDNDDAGREHVRKTIEALRGFAASIRVVDLPGLGRTEDVTDWLKTHTPEELAEVVKKARPAGIRATATGLLNAADIKPREWIYQPHYIRQFVSLLISTGGIGKSSLAIVEALAMVSGRPLLGVTPLSKKGGPLRVWYWNGEDPLEELYRRFAAAMKHYGMTADQIGEDRLFINSGRANPIVLAEEDKRIVRLNTAVVTEVIETVRANKIDVAIIDPFVTTHRVNENDNGAIDLVVKAWNRIAEETGTAVMLVHHSRKPNGSELTVDDTRGASALLAAARSARTINTMTSKEAEECEIEERERRSYFNAYVGKANLTSAPEDRAWYKIVGVDLQNGFELNDVVGVVTPWAYPRTPVPQTTDTVIRRACDAIKAGGPWRDDQRSKKEPWVGEPIAEALTLNLARKPDKKAVAKLVRDWLASGILKRVQRRDQHRELKTYVEVGDGAPAKADLRAAADGKPEASAGFDESTAEETG